MPSLVGLAIVTPAGQPTTKKVRQQSVAKNEPQRSLLLSNVDHIPCRWGGKGKLPPCPEVVHQLKSSAPDGNSKQFTKMGGRGAFCPTPRRMEADTQAFPAQRGMPLLRHGRGYGWFCPDAGEAMGKGQGSDHPGYAGSDLPSRCIRAQQEHAHLEWPTDTCCLLFCVSRRQRCKRAHHKTTVVRQPRHLCPRRETERKSRWEGSAVSCSSCVFPTRNHCPKRERESQRWGSPVTCSVFPPTNLCPERENKTCRWEGRADT